MYYAEPEQVVDAQCHCKTCESSTQETYRIRAVCTNCGKGSTVVFRKGDKAKFGVLGPECPKCGTRSLIRSSTWEA